MSSQIQIDLESLSKLDIGIIFINDKKQIQFWNSAAESITGILSENITGKPFEKDLLKHFDENNNELIDSLNPINKAVSANSIIKDNLYIQDNKEVLIPVTIMVMPYRNSETGITGVIEFFTQPVTIENLEKAYNKLKEKLDDSRNIMKKLLYTSEKLNKQLEESYYRDQLTGIYNRLFINNELPGLLEEFQLSGLGVSLLLIDIDNLEKNNSKYGYLAGDEIIKRTVKIITNSSRNTDILCRFLGKSFILLSPGTNIENAESMAEVIRKNINITKFKYNNREMISTVSIGISFKEPYMTHTLEKLVNFAQEALLTAKNEGKNKTVVNRKE